MVVMSLGGDEKRRPSSTPKDSAEVASSSALLERAGTSSNREEEEKFISQMGNVKNYEEVALIGTGAYGTVYKARNLADNGQIVALKKVRVRLTDDGVPMNTLREIMLLRQLDKFQHPNIVRLLDICHGRRLERERQLILFLVFEHIDQDLATYLERCPSPGLGPDRIKDLMFQLLCGVDFLHSNRIVHRDLKPQNILITSDYKVKIADFGLARIYESQMVLTSVVVTLWYRAPEVLLQSGYTTAVDLWACGCIFAELFNRMPLFGGQTENEQLGKIFDLIGMPEPSEWPEGVGVSWRNYSRQPGVSLGTAVPEICDLGKDLLERMLLFNSACRVSARDALAHRYFTDDSYVPLLIALAPALCSPNLQRRRVMSGSEESNQETLSSPSTDRNLSLTDSSPDK